MNALDITDSIIHALEHDDWNVDRISEKDGTILEIERWTDQTDYDYIGDIDMRGKDKTDPDEWIQAAEDCYEAFDPIDEASLWIGGNGAPSLRDMLDDFEDFKNNTLSQIPDIVRRAVRTNMLANHIAAKLEHDGWNSTIIGSYEGVILEFSRIAPDGNEYTGEFDMRDKDASDPEEWMKAAEAPNDETAGDNMKDILERVPALVREAIAAEKETR